MKKIHLISLITFGLLISITYSCRKMIVKLPKKTVVYDCPRLKSNFKDVCRTASGDKGLINRKCQCDTSLVVTPTYDCPRLKLNIGDKCKTASGKSGIVDRNCNCN